MRASGCRASIRIRAVSVVSPLTGSRRPALLLMGLRPAEIAEIEDRAMKEGLRTFTCSTASQAKELLRGSCDVQAAAILLDEASDPARTHQALSDFRRRNPHIPVILVADSSSMRPSGYGGTGANEYVARPLVPEQVLQRIRAAVDGASSRPCEERRRADKPLEPVSFDELVGNSPSFRHAIRLASHCAAGSGHVLIEGESGTGRHTLARAIHCASPRSQKPLARVQVDGASEATLHSTLFGHVCGAFVGAFETQIGLLQRCAGATILFDKIDRLPLPIQEHLRQALDEGCARPVGGTRDYPVDVRVVALSSEPLSDLAGREAFDARLFEMLGQTRIVVPPLRERRDDIGLLAQHFLRTISRARGAGPVSIDEDAVSLLRRCNWPANVRQLQDTLLCAVERFGSRVLRAEHFHDSEPSAGWTRRHGPHPAECVVSLFTERGHVRPLADIEADVIRLAIERYGGRISEVARRLGIGRSTLYRRLAEIEDASSRNDNTSSTEHPEE